MVQPLNPRLDNPELLPIPTPEFIPLPFVLAVPARLDIDIPKLLPMPPKLDAVVELDMVEEIVFEFGDVLLLVELGGELFGVALMVDAA